LRHVNVLLAGIVTFIFKCKSVLTRIQNFNIIMRPLSITVMVRRFIHEILFIRAIEDTISVIFPHAKDSSFICSIV
jgi:hypothetical protein